MLNFPTGYLLKLLQLEIQNKLKAINNVIDMLTGIIGDSKMLEKSKSGDKVKVNVVDGFPVL